MSTTASEVASSRRDRVVIGVAVLFLALGVLDLWRGVAPMLASPAAPRLAGDDVTVLAIGVAALIGGAFVMRGANWARWLLAVWMAFHVAISVGSLRKAGAHLAIFGFVAYLLFRSSASAHFSRRHAPALGHE